MLISPVFISNTNNNIYLQTNKNNNTVCFKANPNSKKLNFSYKDFFVNIRGYGKNTTWAKKVKTITDNTVEKIKTTNRSDEVLPYVANGIHEANQYCPGGIWKKEHSGILRTQRKGYGPAGDWQGETIYTKIINQYKSYESKLKPLIKNPLKNPYNDISTTTVQYTDKTKQCLELVHGDYTKINNALDRVGGKYFYLRKDYISHPEKVKNDKLPQINSDIAEIRWLLAHSMPWERGSDSISNIFIRSIYKSMGIKTYPIKKGISLDLEAFCTPLNEYKQNFENYFEKPPIIVN